MLVNVGRMPTHPEATLANLVDPQLCVKKRPPYFSGGKKKEKN